MQLPAAVSHQIVHYRSPEEQLNSFSTIGEEELYKLVKSAKPTTCILDPIPSKLLKEVLPEVIDPLLAIIYFILFFIIEFLLLQIAFLHLISPHPPYII